jgi:polysaccharide export outer membrane protein
MFEGARDMKTSSDFCRAAALCLAILLPSASAAQVVDTPPTAVAPGAPTAPALAPDTGPAPGPVLSGPTVAESSQYPLGPQDVIDYNVLGTNDRARARVDADGTIQTRLGGRIAAAGRTPKELGADIAKVLKAGGFYADPVVNVEVVGYGSRFVEALGSFATPGTVPLSREFHLSEILARVGGVRGDAADYIILRSGNEPDKRFLISKLTSGDQASDPVIKPGDKIFAPQAEIFYISGEVKAPGTYALRSNMTIAQAIARGGGLTDSGSDSKVKVRRGDKIIKLNGDAKVEPGDVLTIGERLF